MAEQKRLPTVKSPSGAAVLSAVFPGVGFFYLGNVLKGMAYILIFIVLIILQTEGSSIEHVAFALMLAGFYFFQIFDTYNEARKMNLEETPGDNGKAKEKDSLFAASIILAAGIIFQLVEFEILRFKEVKKFWPIILIVLGARFIYSYTLGNKGESKEDRYRSEKEENGGKNE